MSPLLEATQEAAPNSIATTLGAAGTPPVLQPPRATLSALLIQILEDVSALASSLDGTEILISALEGQLRATEQDEIFKETLNTIDEHITSLQSPPGTSALNAAATDFGTEHVEVDLGEKRRTRRMK